MKRSLLVRVGNVKRFLENGVLGTHAHIITLRLRK